MGGCAKAPTSIEAISVDASRYAGTTCLQLNSQAKAASASYSDVATKQDQKRTDDTVSVALFGMPMHTLTGDYEAEIARLKGEQEAIRRAMVAKRCTLT
jgi:hypothetical protein